MKDVGYRGCWGLRILETDEGCWGWRMLGLVSVYFDNVFLSVFW